MAGPPSATPRHDRATTHAGHTTWWRCRHGRRRRHRLRTQGTVMQLVCARVASRAVMVWVDSDSVALAAASPASGRLLESGSEGAVPQVEKWVASVQGSRAAVTGVLNVGESRPAVRPLGCTNDQREQSECTCVGTACCAVSFGRC